MARKIGNRIILSVAAILVIAFIYLAIYYSIVIKEEQYTQIRMQLEQTALLVDSHLMMNSRSRSPEDIQVALSSITGQSLYHITVADHAGLILADSSPRSTAGILYIEGPDVKAAKKGGTGHAIRYSFLYNSQSIYVALKTQEYIIRIERPLDEMQRNWQLVRRRVVIVTVLILVTAILMLAWITRRITNPIQETLAFTRQFSRGDFSRRILNYSDDDFGLLQRTLNIMADTIVDKIDNLIFEQNKLKTILEAIEDGIAVIDQDKRLLIANRSFQHYLDIGIAPEGRSYYELIRHRKLNKYIEDCLIESGTNHFSIDMYQGKKFEVQLQSITEENLLQGLLVVLHDVTEKQKIEQIKTDLVSNMSHELKTPIAILKGYLETIEANLHRPEMLNELLGRALANVDRQNAIITDILKLNRMESSSDFNDELINIKTIIDDCVNILSPKAVNKKVILHSNVDLLERSIHGNRFLAEEVFFNLIDNAINYNCDGGSVDIFSTVHQDRIEITVSDTGVGIPEESMDRIFERFYRVDKSRSRATGGTGLGLSIVKHAVELLNWSISVDSSEDGTVFRVSIY